MLSLFFNFWRLIFILFEIIPSICFFYFEACFYLMWFYLYVRSSHKPLFVRMTPLQSDWSQMGLKGIIPSLLHHTLLGYNFLIPDAVGNTTDYGSFFSSLRRTYCSYDWWAQKHDCLTWKIIMHFYCMLLKNYSVCSILRGTIILCPCVKTKKEHNSWLWNSFKQKKTLFILWSGGETSKHPLYSCNIPNSCDSGSQPVRQLMSVIQLFTLMLRKQRTVRVTDRICGVL